MPLRRRIVLAAALAAVVLSVVMSMSAWVLTGREFTRLESLAAEQTLDRLERVFVSQLEALDAKASDWASWDDSYRFAQDRDPGFVASNLSAEAFRGMRLDCIAMADPAGGILLAEMRDHASAEPLPREEELLSIIRPGGALATGPGPGSGLVRSGGSWWLAAARPLLTSQGEGPARGRLLFARRFDPEEIARLGDLAGMPLRCEIVPDLAELPGGRALVPRHQDLLVARLVVRDALGQPALVLAADLPRPLMAAGRSLFGSLLAGAVAGSLVAGLALVLVLERLVVRRVGRMERDLAIVAASADPSYRVAEQGRDELGILAGTVNRTLAALAQSQYQLEEALRLQSALLGAIPDRMLLVHADGRCECLQREQGGEPPGPGRHLRDLVPEEAVREALALVARVAGGGEPGSCLYRQSGEEVRHLELRAFPCDPGRAIVLVRDVTDRLQGEELLRQAGERAEAANRAKGAFLATMSHELRTPLNGVLGMSELLLNDVLRPEQKARLRTIRSCAEDLLGLINDLLDLSKIEAERIELVPEVFDPSAAVEHVIELLAPRAEAKGIELAFIPAPDLPTQLRADGHRLRQVLTNLLGNAVKFTESGAVWIEVGMIADAEGGPALRFAVHDSGPGIEPEVQARLFRPFEQGDATVAVRHGGTGLGLVISRRLVELMGGSLELESRPGEGSDFFFSVRVELLASGSGRVPGPVLAGRRLLLLTDHPILGRSLVAQLATLGAAIRCCRTEEARAVLEADGPPDLLLIASQAGRSAACELRAWIRDRWGDGSPPVLCLPPAGVQIACASRACGRSLARPVRGSELRRQVLAVLAPDLLPEASPEAPAPLPRWDEVQVLVADDQEVNLLVIDGMLRQRGIAPVLVRGGCQVLEQVQAPDRSWDLLLLDQQMPDLAGDEVVRAIRRHEGPARHLPIVAMTAQAMPGDREGFLALGLDDHLPKPIHPSELDRILRRWLGEGDRRISGQQCILTGFGHGHVQAWDRLVGDLGPETSNAVLGAFRREGQDQVDRLGLAVATGDRLALGRAAHALKGAAGNVGCLSLAEAARAMEQAIQAGDPQEQIAVRMAAVRSAWSEVVRDLQGRSAV